MQWQPRFQQRARPTAFRFRRKFFLRLKIRPAYHVSRDYAVCGRFFRPEVVTLCRARHLRRAGGVCTYVHIWAHTAEKPTHPHELAIIPDDKLIAQHRSPFRFLALRAGARRRAAPERRTLG